MIFVAIVLIVAAGSGFLVDFSSRAEVSKAAEAVQKSAAEVTTESVVALKKSVDHARKN